MPVLLKTYNILKLNNILAIAIFRILGIYSKCKDFRLNLFGCWCIEIKRFNIYNSLFFKEKLLKKQGIKREF